MFYTVGLAFASVEMLRIFKGLYDTFTEETWMKRVASALVGGLDGAFLWFIGASLGWW